MRSLKELSKIGFLNNLANKAYEFSGYNRKWEIKKGMLYFEDPRDHKSLVILDVIILSSGCKVVHEVYGRMKHLGGLSVMEQDRIISILS